MTVIHLSSRHGAASAPASDVAPDWREQKACADQDPDLFFPDWGEDDAEGVAAAYLQARQAQEVCWSCPVLEQCAAFADATGATSGVWGGVWLDEKQIHAEEARRREVRQMRLADRERAKVAFHAGINLALERGTDVIMARLRGEEDHVIAAWAGVPVAAARRALLILLPPADDKRVDIRGLERALRSSLRIRVLVARGRSDKDIARLLRSTPALIEQARRVIAHRDAAARQYVELTA